MFFFCLLFSFLKCSFCANRQEVENVSASLMDANRYLETNACAGQWMNKQAVSTCLCWWLKLSLLWHKQPSGSWHILTLTNFYLTSVFTYFLSGLEAFPLSLHYKEPKHLMFTMIHPKPNSAAESYVPIIVLLWSLYNKTRLEVTVVMTWCYIKKLNSIQSSEVDVHMLLISFYFGCLLNEILTPLMDCWTLTHSSKNFFDNMW